MASGPHVIVAAAGFTTLLLATGYGLYERLIHWPVLQSVMRRGGIFFLFWISWRLAKDNGKINRSRRTRRLGRLTGR